VRAWSSRITNLSSSHTSSEYKSQEGDDRLGKGVKPLLRPSERLQNLFDGVFGAGNRHRPRKRYPRFVSTGFKPHDPLPAGRVGCLQHLVLDALVLHQEIRPWLPRCSMSEITAGPRKNFEISLAPILALGVACRISALSRRQRTCHDADHHFYPARLATRSEGKRT
jgi:hypothetical protein